MKKSQSPDTKLSVAQILTFTHLELPPLNPPSPYNNVVPSFIIAVFASYLL